jgi:hypothetical protein
VNLIAFNGRAGAGKDTAADILVRYARFEKLAFADALRAEVSEAFELENMQALLHDRALKEQPHPALALRDCKEFCFVGAVALATHATVNSEWLDAPRSPRQILQWWGTEFRRRRDPRYWVKALHSRIMTRDEGGQHRFVVTDCRFPNEYAYIRSMGGQMWRVHRDNLPEVEGTHESATALQNIGAEANLQNDGSLDDLRDLVLRHWWSMDSGLPADLLQVRVVRYAEDASLEGVAA